VLTDLVEAAHAGGGLDNITIIVSDVVEGGADDEAFIGETGLTPPRHAARGLVLGAAVTREIPAIRSKPIDLGDGAAEETTDASGNIVPAAPAPALTGTGGGGRYEPESGQRRRRLGLWGAIIAVVLVVGLAAYGTYAYAMTQFLVAPTGQQVGIYQGVQGSLLGLSTNRLVENTGIQMSDLPPAYQEKVRAGITIRQGGLDAAKAAAEELRTRASQCVAQRLARAQATQTPTASPSPSTTAASASQTLSASPGTSASTSAQPSTGTLPVQSPTTVPTPSAPDEC
jgi:protein phosphatase